MVNRRKGFSAKQSRRKTRQMNDSMVGTHNVRGSHARRQANASSMSFSDGRTSARASRSQLETMIPPATTSGEGRAAYRQRIQQRRFAEQIQRRARIRRIAVGIVAVALVLGIAIGAGYLAFRGTVGPSMALRDSDAGQGRVAVKATGPY